MSAILLVIAAAVEPYHIDELRQVSSYDGTPSEIIEANLAQQQPPLDALIAAGLQRLVGQGDLRQRATSVVAGVVALGLLGWLCAAGGWGMWGALAVLALGLSPVFIQHAAYARPYALPLVLMLGFVLATQRWLAKRRLGALLVMVILAIALPLSRTTEPTMFLLAVAAMFLWRLIQRRGLFKPDLAVMMTAMGGAVLVGGPVYLAVRERAEGYVADAATPKTKQLLRLGTDLPSALADALPLWPIAVALAIAALILARGRRLLVPTWWWWALLAVPALFAVAFFMTTPLDQPYYDRYTFFWLPPFAVAVAAAGAGQSSWALGPRPARGALAGALAVVLAASTLSSLQTLVTQNNPDWREASTVVTGATSRGTVVVYDRLVPLGAYRGAFWGQRYLEGRRKVATAGDLVARPDRISPEASVAFLLLQGADEARLRIPRWTSVPVDAYFTLYLPPRGLTGTDGAAFAHLELAEHVSLERGALLRLASAALFMESGDMDRARALVLDVAMSEDPTVRNAVVDEVDSTMLRRVLP